jgi:hypothetical protein
MTYLLACNLVVQHIISCNWVLPVGNIFIIIIIIINRKLFENASLPVFAFFSKIIHFYFIGVFPDFLDKLYTFLKCYYISKKKLLKNVHKNTSVTSYALPYYSR